MAIVMTKEGQIRTMRPSDLRMVADLEAQVKRLTKERDIYGCALINIATLTASMKAIKHFAKGELERGLATRPKKQQAARKEGKQ